MLIKEINNYLLYEKEPNTICDGARVFTKTFFFNTNNDFKNRLIRVYLPSTYNFDNPNLRFDVLYMFDGKNLFDDCTSFVGEWRIDETIEERIHKYSEKGMIVVGIDAPNTDIDRSCEMFPDDLNPKKKYAKGKGYLNLLGDFVINKVKKDIDNTFYTNKENTYVGGSSMGGLAAWYCGSHYPSIFKVALCFSPAFFLINKRELNAYLNQNNKLNNKFIFYVGGVGFESIFVKDTKDVHNYYLKNNINSLILIDKYKEHNEQAWSEYFRFIFKEINY